MGETQLGRMQFRIVQVLWDRQRANAREITEALNETEPVAHSTVSDGRFTVPDVPTGCEYAVVAQSPPASGPLRFTVKAASVRPGETTDVGDIQLKD